MTFEVITGGRDEIEHELVLSLFQPWNYDYAALKPRWDALAPRGKNLISLAASSEGAQSLPHQADEEQD
jgi:hypothetical protein